MTPDSRTTGTTGVPRRKRAGSHSIHLSTRLGQAPRSPVFSIMPLPRVNHFLSRSCHWFGWNAPCIVDAVETAGYSGERHENLPAVAVDRYTFDRDPLHFSVGTAIRNAFAVAAHVCCRPHHGIAKGNTPFPARMSSTCLLGTA